MEARDGRVNGLLIDANTTQEGVLRMENVSILLRHNQGIVPNGRRPGEVGKVMRVPILAQ